MPGSGASLHSAGVLVNPSHDCMESLGLQQGGALRTLGLFMVSEQAQLSSFPTYYVTPTEEVDSFSKWSRG